LTPNITVVIPTIGRLAFLLDAVRSVAGQSVPVSQIILIADGVNEEVHQGMSQITASFPGVELHRLDTRQGVSAARNTGLEHATGDYIVFLDDDDLLHPKMVELALEKFSKDQAIDVVVCLYQVIFSPTGLGDYPIIFPFNFKLLENHPLSKIDNSNFAPKWELEHEPISAFLRYLIPINSCVVKRSAIGENRFPEDLSHGEDTFFWLSLGCKGCQFHLSESPYAFVRRHGQNTTRSKSTYLQEIPKCYSKIQSSKMLSRRPEIFLVKLKLFYFSWRQNPFTSLHLLFGLLQYPMLLSREIGKFFRITARDRKRLLRYYFLD